MADDDEYQAAQRRAIAARVRGDYAAERVELDTLALMDLGSVTDQVARVLRRHEHRIADVCRCGADMSEYVSSEAKRFSPRKHRAHVAQALNDAGLLALGMGCSVDVYDGARQLRGVVKHHGNATGPLCVVIDPDSPDMAMEDR